MRTAKLTLSVSLSLFVFLFLLTPSAEAFDINCFPMAGLEKYVCSALPVEPQFVKPEPIRDEFIMETRYVRLADLANVHASPSRASEIVRNVGDGFLFSSVYGMIKGDDGAWWYIINPGEYMHADDIKETAQSQFRGVEINRQPERPFGWIVVRDFIPSSEPGGEPDERFSKMYRYDFFQVYNAVEDNEGWLWYNIGDGRWIKQTNVSLVDVDPRPEDVGPNEFWTEVDLYEQTLAAYEGDRMVFATLVSSGLNRWPTYEGTFQVDPQYRYVAEKMSGAEGRVDYYFVEDVPHTMYFDKLNEIALHGAYWHDRFGYKHSHGCVNMPPQDSEWVFYWSEKAENDLWVHVHTSDPLVYFDRYDPEESFSGP